VFSATIFAAAFAVVGMEAKHFAKPTNKLAFCFFAAACVSDQRRNMDIDEFEVQKINNFSIVF
jgi:hypothetical protein